MTRVSKVAALQELGLGLSAQGRFEEALVSLQEAEALAHRVRFGMGPFLVPDVVHARASVLYDAGRWEDAVDVAREAARLRRATGSTDSDQLARLSDSLELEANSLTRLQRLQEADAVSAEVISMRARLPWSERARALLNRAAMLTEAGRHAEGLEAVLELVRSARDRPASDGGDATYSSGLVNLAVQLRMNGRWHEAVEVQQLAIGEVRLAAHVGGDDVQADLAIALANLANLHLESGRPEDAEAPGAEALALRERLAPRSLSSLAALTDSLNNHGIVLAELGRPAEAEPLVARCVDLRRRLHDAQPRAFGRALANALVTHCDVLTRCGRAEAGLVAGREGVEMLRRLAAGDVRAYGPWLAGGTDTLAEATAAALGADRALAVTEESVDLARRALADNPAGFASSHATILLAAAERHAADQPEQARGWAGEALDLVSALSAAEPEAYAVVLERARRVAASLG
ncbi:tetratricopeptide repeat protein [Nocardioides flavus (ex Wang et al. 2016)]|uniref:tetratricopeptide repeat protein n=1 Tax=Nocardioides flavus (ex Wang et al. 2016) TaxID=2058780 RepID=UPI00174C4B76|nr:tetratricopeptide repeat protein [Nocardioides flavus (ex Wang et al. 2016)]